MQTRHVELTQQIFLQQSRVTSLFDFGVGIFCYKETSRKHHGENGQVSSVLFQTEDIFDSFPAVQVGFHYKYCIRIQILISLVHRLLLLQQKGILGEIENLMLRGKVVEQLKQEQRRKKKDSFLFLSFGSFFSCYAAISSVARCEMKIIFYLRVLNHKISRAALSEYQIHEATIQDLVEPLEIGSQLT